jgi:hypothetical protein
MWRQPGNVTISTFTRTETTRDALELMLCELECVACESLTEEKGAKGLSRLINRRFLCRDVGVAHHLHLLVPVPI